MFSFIKEKSTTHLFIQSTALFLLMGKIMSWKLWLGERAFPIVPAFDFLQAIPSQIHFALLLLSIICLTVCIIKPGFYKALFVLLIAELLSCLLDQNRWQPWEYQYVFMFFVLWINRKSEQKSLLLLLLIFSCTYLYTGIQKFNPHFIKIVWKQTILEGYFHLSKEMLGTTFITRLGYIVPCIEIGFGIGLLFHQTRKFVLALLIAMHLIVLVIIGPWGIEYNQIVWPWNAAMAVFFVIIWNKQIDVRQIKTTLLPRWNIITVVAWTIMPAFNFIGYWDYFFSMSLYAGRIDMCYIEIKNPPPNFELQQYYRQKKNDSTNTKSIVVQTWAMGEFNTPSCPQARIYKKIKQQWKVKYPTVDAQFYWIDRSKKKTVIKEL